MMNTIECNNVNEFKQTAIIKFGTISPIKNEVISTEVWNVNEDQLGLFFISRANNEAITKGSVEILANGNIRVWSSPIKELPENTLSIDGETANIYITSKVLEPKSISDWRNGEYIINVDIEGIKSLTLNIEGFDSSLDDESNEQPIDTNEVDIECDVLEDYILVEDEDEVTNSDALNYEEELFNNVTTPVANISDKDTNNDTLDDIFDLIDKVEISSIEANIGDSDEKSKSINELLMEFCFNNKPFKTHCYTLNDQLEDTAKSDIVIEKNSDQYLVVINNLFNRPIHLFDGDEPYFKFNGSVDEFINKIMKTICRNYAMTEKEFEEMSKVILLDEELTDEICERDNLSYINRTNALNMINPNHNEIIIDVYGNECNIIYNNNNDLMKINCYGIDNSNKISMYNGLSEIVKNVGAKNTYLTGEVATNEIANLLGVEGTERFYNIAKLI